LANFLSLTLNDLEQTIRSQEIYRNSYQWTVLLMFHTPHYDPRNIAMNLTGYLKMVNRGLVDGVNISDTR